MYCRIISQTEINPHENINFAFYSYISSLTMVSMPGEIYTFGTIFIYIMVFSPIGVLIASRLYLPVFEQIKLVSIYKVGQLSFSRESRPKTHSTGNVSGDE